MFQVSGTIVLNKLEINKNFKKEVGITIKSKETSNQLSSLEIASYPLYRQHWVLTVYVHPAGYSYIHGCTNENTLNRHK